MARGDIQVIDVTGPTGRKSKRRVKADSVDRYQAMSQANEEQAQRRQERRERGAERAADKARQPSTVASVKTKS